MGTNRAISADLVARLQQVTNIEAWDPTATLDSALAEFKNLAQAILDALRARVNAAAEQRATLVEARNATLEVELSDTLNDNVALETSNLEKTRLIALLSRLNPEDAPAPAHRGSSVKIPDPPIFTDSQEE